MNLSSNLIGNSYYERNFLHKLLLTNTQVSKICKTFANGSSANTKFSKTQLSKMIQSGGFALYELTGPFIRGLSSLPRSIIKRISSITGSVITLANNEIKDIKVITSLENRGILLKGTTRKITSQEGGF